jgi:hypothetical protein
MAVRQSKVLPNRLLHLKFEKLSKKMIPPDAKNNRPHAHGTTATTQNSIAIPPSPHQQKWLEAVCAAPQERQESSAAKILVMTTKFAQCKMWPLACHSATSSFFVSSQKSILA